MKQVLIHGKDGLLVKATLCDTFLSESRGYMFRRPSGTFLFELPWRTRIFGAIHMFFVSFPLQVIWLDKEMRVTDTVTARPWGIYWPKYSAAYIIETPADQPLPVVVGDRLRLEPY